MSFASKIGVLALGATIGFAAPATAGIVTIDFTGNGGLQAGNSMNFTQDGVTVTVTAGAFARNNEYNINSQIGQYSQGLGATTSYSYDYQMTECRFLIFDCHKVTKTAHVTDGDHAVDDGYETLTHGVREYLTLDFNGLDVTLLGVTFGAHGLLDDSLVQISSTEETLYSGGKSTLKASDFADHTDSAFDFIAFGGLFPNSWKLASVTFQFADIGPDPDQVPVPASLTLLGAGLLGLGFARRRKAA